MNNSLIENWDFSDAEVFWSEIAPCDHVLHIYENDEVFFNILSKYIAGGITAGESVVIIATENHLIGLEKKLELIDINIIPLVKEHRYIALSAEGTLEKFMVDGWPNEELFMQTITKILRKAKANNRKVRAFGEMVALLWAQGMNGATVQLEHLWNKLRQQEDFCLFCAYPKIGFTQDLSKSAQDICCSHTKLVKAGILENDLSYSQYKTAY